MKFPLVESGVRGCKNKFAPEISVYSCKDVKTNDTRPLRSPLLMMAGFFAALFIIDWALFFRHAGHFFHADSVFLLDHRALSFFELLREFARLQLAGRYRPLAHSLYPSILYPIFG